MTPIDVPKGSYPDQDLRRSTPASRRFSGVIRGQKDRRDEQTAARQDRFFARPEQPESDDIAALRAQAQEDRELAASARRQADEARRRAS